MGLRRVEVAARFLRGEPQARIAERLNVSVSTIKRDLQAIRKEWLAARVRDYALAQETELRKLDYLESEAWEAWQRSQQPIETSKISGAGEALSESRRGERSTRSQFGAAKFLEIIARCIDRRCAILRIPAPALAGPPIVVESMEIRQELLMNDEFLEYCRHRASLGDAGRLCLVDSTRPLADVPALEVAGPSADGPGAG
jgi:hypothetical protein